MSRISIYIQILPLLCLEMLASLFATVFAASFIQLTKGHLRNPEPSFTYPSFNIRYLGVSPT